MASFARKVFERAGVAAARGEQISPKSCLRTRSQDHVPEVFRVGSLNGFSLYEASIAEIQDALQDGKFSSYELVEFYLARVRKIDDYLECVMEINPDALSIAKGLDEERARGHLRSPIHGIPILTKDNIATKDQMQTTAGSWALLGSKAPMDADIVSHLRQAGAVLLGHANMSEWASVRSRVYSTGYSPRRGQTRNPYDISKSPYGSSSGSAVAVSANIVPLAIGTETDTSIIGPAGRNGVVGIKPTVGLCSSRGIIPISKHFDTAGPFGRQVRDAAIGLNALVGKYEQINSQSSASSEQVTDYCSYVTDRTALKGASFGLPWTRCWEFVAQSDMDVVNNILDAIRDVGAEVVWTDFASAKDRIADDGQWNWELGEPERSEFTVVKVDAYNGINEYLSESTDTPMRSLEDIVAYNTVNKGTEGAEPGDHPAFPSGQDVLQEIIATKGVEDPTYTSALQYIRQKCREEGIDAALHRPEGDLDALSLCDGKGVGQQIAAQAGYPIVSIPIGLGSGDIPIALTIQHTAWKEDVLIKWASAIEDLIQHSFGGRPTPTYRNCLFKNIPVAR